jgi:hypothetical protein
MVNKYFSHSLTEEQCKDCNKVLRDMLISQMVRVNPTKANDIMPILVTYGYIIHVGSDSSDFWYKLTPSGINFINNGGFIYEGNNEQKIDKTEDNETE